MFESVELGRTLPASEFREREPSVRERLLEAQFALRDADLSVVVVLAGLEGAGRSEVLHRLLEWLDPRRVEAHALRPPSEEERERPRFWRFWRRLPRRGRLGIFLGSWYAEPAARLAAEKLGGGGRERAVRRIVEFEELLVHGRTLLLKVWLHVTKKQQKKRFKRLEKSEHDSWRVTKRDWAAHERYDEERAAWEELVEHTDTPDAPWTLVEAADPRHRDLAVAERLLAALEERLARPAPPAPPRPAGWDVPPEVNRLRALDLGRTLDEDDYESRLPELQSRLGRLARKLGKHDLSAVVVFEGSDAAGKGGAIRRVTRALDPRFYRVVRVAAPDEEAREHPWLWRFWQHLPRHGELRLFDRSWYGRVLVERVEGFCTPDDVERAYGEINAFEEQLDDDGVVVVKLWLAIDPEEQLRRFQAREQTGFKRYKLTPDDWRNREKQPAYEAAACEMFARTGPPSAPWTLVEANDKRHARVTVLETLCERLERALASKR